MHQKGFSVLLSKSLAMAGRKFSQPRKSLFVERWRFAVGVGCLQREQDVCSNSGMFEFRRWRRYAGAVVLVRVSPVFGCQVALNCNEREQ